MIAPSGGLRIAVTGAAGFIGQAVVARIQRGALGPVRDLRLNDVQAFDRPDATIVQGSYVEAEVRDRLLAGGVDVLFHLASLPGGAAERDPVLGRRVNLDGSIALIDELACLCSGQGAPIVVYASSIAALGKPVDPVDEATALRPNGSYGTHKAMVELYLADLTRRGLIDARSVRPAGIVARPRTAYAGFATAWMSDLFHAARERRDITIPVRADAHVWLQSIDAVADNILHAARMPADGLAAHRAWTLPATVARLDLLVATLNRHEGFLLQVEYGPSLSDSPPLNSDRALALGFSGDGSVEALVDSVAAALTDGHDHW